MSSPLSPALSHPFPSVPSLTLAELYGKDGLSAASARVKKLKDEFFEHFSEHPDYLFSAPGRTEIGGNHTDHQNGCVLCGSVDLDMLCFVKANGTKEVRLYSEQFPPVICDISKARPDESEFGKSDALIKGVAAALREKGYEISGFDGMMTSRIPAGMGLSSSAAFEILVGTVFSALFCGGEISPVDLAKAGKYAEQTFFGKPCGLMDQIGCGVGGCVFVDFKKEQSPKIENISIDFSKLGLVPCVINTRSGHSDLTDDYAAIRNEMEQIASHFGKDKLRFVESKDFYDRLPLLRKEYGDRAVLRAMHFFDENERARAEFNALKNGDKDLFLDLVNRSGRSSESCLENIWSIKDEKNQAAQFTIALCRRLLNGEGAVRIHGGGFGGTVQAFVPIERFDGFKRAVDEVLSPGSCCRILIRKVGSCILTDAEQPIGSAVINK